MKRNFITICSIICSVFIAENVSAQQATHYTGNSQQLQHRWIWAKSTAQKKANENGFWIGYSFTRLMKKNSWMGSFYSGKRKDVHQLCDVIYGIRDVDPYEKSRNGMPLQETAKYELAQHDNIAVEIPQVEKEIAVMFYFERTAAGKFELTKVKLSNLTLYFNFHRAPVYWLGQVETDSSLNFLMKLFAINTKISIQKNLIHAIGSHNRPQKTLPFLKNIILGQQPDTPEFHLQRINHFSTKLAQA